MPKAKKARQDAKPTESSTAAAPARRPRTGEPGGPVPKTLEQRKRSGPICGAKRRNGGGPCLHPAGWQTDHPGTGRCRLHGGKTKPRVKTVKPDAPSGGRYDNLKRPRLRELIERYKADEDPLDLMPEAQLLRALLMDWVERHDEYVEGLQRWHASFSVGYQKALAKWVREEHARLRELLYQDLDFAERAEAIEGEKPFPRPEDYMNKPSVVPDITTAASLVEKVTATVERIDKMRKANSLGLETINALLHQVGVELVMAVRQEVADEELRGRVLATFERRWRDAPLITENAGTGRRPDSHGPN